MYNFTITSVGTQIKDTNDSYMKCLYKVLVEYDIIEMDFSDLNELKDALQEVIDDGFFNNYSQQHIDFVGKFLLFLLYNVNTIKLKSPYNGGGDSAECYLEHNALTNKVIEMSNETSDILITKTCLQHNIQLIEDYQNFIDEYFKNHPTEKYIVDVIKKHSGITITQASS